MFVVKLTTCSGWKLKNFFENLEICLVSSKTSKMQQIAHYTPGWSTKRDQRCQHVFGSKVLRTKGRHWTRTFLGWFSRISRLKIYQIWHYIPERNIKKILDASLSSESAQKRFYFLILNMILLSRASGLFWSLYKST